MSQDNQGRNQTYNSQDPIVIEGISRQSNQQSNQQSSQQSNPQSRQNTVGIQSIEQSHVYWQTQRSPQVQQNNLFMNEPPSIRPLLIALAKCEEKFSRAPSRSGGNSALSDAMMEREHILRKISKEREKLAQEQERRKKHQQNVEITINRYLEKGFSIKGDLSKILRVQYALKLATEEREVDSQNIVNRDAEYYLHGLYATMSGDIAHTVATSFAAVYDFLKSLNVAWINEMLQVDEDKPVSPPGGAQWAYLGLSDGAENKEGAGRGVEEGDHSLELSVKTPKK